MGPTSFHFLGFITWLMVFICLAVLPPMMSYIIHFLSTIQMVVY